MARSRVRKSYNLNKLPSFTERRVAKMINSVGDLMIADMQRGVSKGIDVNNQKFQALDPKTIAQKRRKGSATPRIALRDTGRMIDGLFLKKRAKPKSQSAIITVSQDRQTIGVSHNKGIPPHLPQRSFFYQADDPKPRIQKPMNKIIEDAGKDIVKSVHVRFV